MFGTEVIGDDKVAARLCPRCGTGRLRLMLSSKTGGFVACSNYTQGGKASCTFRRALSAAAAGEQLDCAGAIIGSHPEWGTDMTVRDGPYGRRASAHHTCLGEQTPTHVLPELRSSG
jgi:topoisomerase IA-like protein